MRSRLRVLFVTQVLDEDSDILGITVTWLRALAQRVAMVHVLALAVGRVSLPDNVVIHSMGKDRGLGKAAQLARFQTIGLSLAARRKVDVVFVHIVPRYALLAAPVARLFRIPIVLWYTHGSVSRTLRWAHRVVSRVVTASAESFRLPSHKVVVTGHGVDAALFDCPPPAASTGPRATYRMVAVGRLSRIKDHETLVRATALLRERAPDDPLHVRIIGAPLYEDDRTYLRELQELTARLGLDDIVEFAGSIPNRALAPEYCVADMVVSTSRTGGVDKVVLEAMACRRPVVTCNDAFAPIFLGMEDALMFPPGDAAALASRLHALRERPHEAVTALGETLRSSVLRDHSVDRWADKTVAVLEAVVGQKRGADPVSAAHTSSNWENAAVGYGYAVLGLANGRPGR